MSPSEQTGVEAVAKDFIKYVLGKDLVAHYFQTICEDPDIESHRITETELFKFLLEDERFKEDLSLIHDFECVMISFRDIKKQEMAKVEEAQAQEKAALAEKAAALRLTGQKAQTMSELERKSMYQATVDEIEDKPQDWSETIKRIKQGLERAQKGLIEDFGEKVRAQRGLGSA